MRMRLTLMSTPVSEYSLFTKSRTAGSVRIDLVDGGCSHFVNASSTSDHLCADVDGLNFERARSHIFAAFLNREAIWERSAEAHVMLRMERV